jgi:diguanylate cyclase (GGDEF)-like protein
MHFARTVCGIRRIHLNNLGVWLIVSSILLALGLWSLGAVLLWTMRENDLAKAVQASDNMVSTMSVDIARNLEMFDLSLQAVVDNLNHPGVESVSKDIRQMILFDRAATAKYLSSIKVLDKDGQITIDSRTLTPPVRDYSTRDYFLVHRQDPNIGLYIGQPFVGARGKYLIGISRRLANSDGSFSGVVVGTMELAYFNDLFGHVVQTPGSVLGLFEDNGTLLMRSPFKRGDIGRDINQSHFFVHMRGIGSGHYQAASAIDGVDRIYSYQKVGDYPLLIGSGISTRDALAVWRRNAWAIGTILLVLGLSTIALAVFANAELRQRELAETRLKFLATTDALTETRNRRGFENALGHRWNEAFSTGTALALLMIDVDHFKDFNDRHGHQAGDRVLITIGRIIEDARRDEHDVVARYGGEEFAVILPGATTDDGYRIAERIRRAIELAGAGQTDVSCPTVSIGVSSRIPNISDGYATIVASADAALYEAKRLGRNRTAKHDFSVMREFSSELAA